MGGVGVSGSRLTVTQRQESCWSCGQVEGEIMETVEAELEALEVVAVGTFHPGVVQPSWLARQSFIPDTEADSANVIVITNDITQFTTEWFTVEVLAERIRVITQLNSYALPLRDLVVGLLRELPEIRVTAFGINHSAHLKLDSEEVWHRVGHRMAPKKFWERVVGDPLTANVTIQGKRESGHKGVVNLSLQPSTRVPFGIFLSSNDHYDLIDSESKSSGEVAAELLSQEYEGSLERSYAFFKALLDYAVEAKEAGRDAE